MSNQKRIAQQHSRWKLPLDNHRKTLPSGDLIFCRFSFPPSLLLCAFESLVGLWAKDEREKKFQWIWKSISQEKKCDEGKRFLCCCLLSTRNKSRWIVKFFIRGASWKSLQTFDAKTFHWNPDCLKFLFDSLEVVVTPSLHLHSYHIENLPKDAFAGKRKRGSKGNILLKWYKVSDDENASVLHFYFQPLSVK